MRNFIFIGLVLLAFLVICAVWGELIYREIDKNLRDPD